MKATLDAAGAIVKTKDNPGRVDVAKVDAKLVSKAKAEIHASLAIPLPFTHDGITITILALSMEGDRLRVDLTADCPTDGPYFFVNPPLQVVIADAVMDAADPTKVKTPRVTADAPDEVLRAIVGQTVYAVAVRMGWGPK